MHAITLVKKYSKQIVGFGYVYKLDITPKINIHSNMTTEKKVMYGLDTSKYPSRMGQPWKDDEVVKLLTSIQKKKSIDDIAKEHERTKGGIRAHIRQLAADYHFNNEMPIEEIQKYTGLSKEDIEDVIKRREAKYSKKNSTDSVKKKIKPTISHSESTDYNELTMKEVVSLLKDIQGKLNMLLEKSA